MNGRSLATRINPLSRAVLAVGLLLPVLLTACGASLEAGRMDLEAGEALQDPQADTGSEPSPAPPLQQLTEVPDSEPATPTPAPARPVAPDFRLYDLDGQEWTLTQFESQPVMLFFWATW
jgi:hypothetical protein